MMGKLINLDKKSLSFDPSIPCKTKNELIKKVDSAILKKLKKLKNKK